MGSAACNVVAFHGSVWLSALRQPAHHRAAPKCHTPLPWLPPVLRQSAQRHQFAKAAQAIAKSSCVHVRWFTVRIQVSRSVAFPQVIFPACGTSGTIPFSHTKGGWRMQRSSIIHHQGKVSLFSFAVPSRPSLTLRSSRHLQAPLVGSLRAAHSGAAYL